MLEPSVICSPATTVYDPAEGLLRDQKNTIDGISLPRIPIWRKTNLSCLMDAGFDGGDAESFPERSGWSARTTCRWMQLFD